jgi:hypothetical protein
MQGLGASHAAIGTLDWAGDYIASYNFDGTNSNHVRTGRTRTEAWHKLEIECLPDSVTLSLDDSVVETLPQGMGVSKVFLYLNCSQVVGNQFHVYWDDFEFEPLGEPDIIAKSLDWNIAAGRVDFSYEVAGADLPQTTAGGLYWSDDTVFDAGDQLAHSFTVNTGQQTYSGSVQTSEFNDPPMDATHLLLAVDPNDTINESEESNNIVARRVAQIVTVDIKPGSDPNSINLGSNGKLPVAILTTPDFDATTVDTSDPSQIQFGDPVLAGSVSPLRANLEDLDKDGDADLILHFSMRDIVAEQALDSDSVVAELTATAWLDPTPLMIKGADSVRIVPSRGSKSSASAAILGDAAFLDSVARLVNISGDDGDDEERVSALDGVFYPAPPA